MPPILLQAWAFGVPRPLDHRGNVCQGCDQYTSRRAVRRESASSAVLRVGLANCLQRLLHREHHR